MITLFRIGDRVRSTYQIERYRGHLGTVADMPRKGSQFFRVKMDPNPIGIDYHWSLKADMLEHYFEDTP
jgi:hypothetical protein